MYGISQSKIVNIHSDHLYPIDVTESGQQLHTYSCILFLGKYIYKEAVNMSTKKSLRHINNKFVLHTFPLLTQQDKLCINGIGVNCLLDFTTNPFNYHHYLTNHITLIHLVVSQQW